MTDKQMEEKKKEFLEKFGLVRYEYNTTRLWQWIEKLVEEVEIEAIENFIKILIENTEVIGDESIRLVYLKGITRKRLEELLEVHN